MAQKKQAHSTKCICPKVKGTLPPCSDFKLPTLSLETTYILARLRLRDLFHWYEIKANLQSSGNPWDKDGERCILYHLWKTALALPDFQVWEEDLQFSINDYM